MMFYNAFVVSGTLVRLYRACRKIGRAPCGCVGVFGRRALFSCPEFGKERRIEETVKKPGNLPPSERKIVTKDCARRRVS